MKKFLNEVYRVLKKGGHFTWVDLRGKDMVRDTESAFEGVDLKCIHEQTITSEVIQALDGIHERKMQMIKLHVPKFLQSAFKDFAGVKKSKIYNAKLQIAILNISSLSRSIRYFPANRVAGTFFCLINRLKLWGCMHNSLAASIRSR